MPNAVRMRRLVALLNRKGYSGELAVRVVREVLAVDADELADIEGGGRGAVAGRHDGPDDVVVGIFDRGH